MPTGDWPSQYALFIDLPRFGVLRQNELLPQRMNEKSPKSSAVLNEPRLANASLMSQLKRGTNVFTVLPMPSKIPE